MERWPSFSSRCSSMRETDTFDCARDSLLCAAIWGRLDPAVGRIDGGIVWDYLIPEWTAPGTVRSA